MLNNDPQLLVAGILGTVEAALGASIAPEQRAAMQQRLQAQLGRLMVVRATAPAALEATVLMADLRGFTALTESVPTPRIVALLNRFFALMIEVVDRHGGIVDKLMGDAVMALFGAPVARPDDLVRALHCAVEMQQAMAALSSQCEQEGDPRLYAGIAVSTGQVMAGTFGSEVHREYTVIGDPVNLAARIEGYSLRGQVLISEASYLGAKDVVEIGTVNEVMVKGKAHPIRLYELKGLNHPEPIWVPAIEVRRSPRIQVDLPVVVRRVEDKRVLSESFVGKVNDLGYFGLSADLPLVLPTYSEILMSLAPQLGAESQVEVYARVLRAQRNRANYRTNLQFTTIDTPGHRRVKQYVDDVLWGKLG